MSDQQRVDFIRLLYDQHGLSQVRITGGEPLLHAGLAELVNSIKQACPGISVALTTNGRLLSRHAPSLRQAGLDRLNVSVDSLNEACYRRITGGRLADVLESLDAARAAGFPEPKINTVVLRGLNDGEVVSLAHWALARGAEIRFLEAMPIGAASAFNGNRFVAASDVRCRLRTRFELTPVASAPGSTATRHRATAERIDGIIGTIAPISEPFCSSCRRIRLTADGRLFPCLLDRNHVDVRNAWRDGRMDHKAITELLATATQAKRERGSVQHMEMIQLGG